MNPHQMITKATGNNSPTPISVQGLGFMESAVERPPIPPARPSRIHGAAVHLIPGPPRPPLGRR